MNSKKGKQLFAFLLAGAAAGIFAAVFWRNSYLDEFERIQEGVLASLEKKMYSRLELFIFLLLQRFKQIGCIVLMFWGIGMPVLYVAGSCAGLAGGIYLFSLCARFGISGIAVFLGSFFPQMLFYLPSIWLALRMKEAVSFHSSRHGKKMAGAILGSLGMLGISLLLLLLGCFSEACFQPSILGYFLKLI